MDDDSFDRSTLWAIFIGIAIALILFALAFGASRARAEPLPKPRPSPSLPVQRPDLVTILPVPTICGLAETISEAAATKAPNPHASGRIGQRALLISTNAQGSFSIIVIAPDGTACLLAGGEDFQIIERVLPPGKDS